jgi:ADP-ribose pyrophosphatase YjhB (NUDIX family)
VHVDDSVLRPLRERFGEPRPLRWAGEVTEEEYGLALGRPGSTRRHDVTLFIFNGDRLALIRKPQFAPGIWRTPGGGIAPGEDFVAGALREALEETGAEVELDRYLVVADATFTLDGRRVDWITHVFSAHTPAHELQALDTTEIDEVRWGTLEELGGPIRHALVTSRRAFWRYRAALHDAATIALWR